MAGLVFAAVVLLIVLTIVWGLAAAEHDRVERSRDRAFLNEVHRLPPEGDADESSH